MRKKEKNSYNNFANSAYFLLISVLTFELIPEKEFVENFIEPSLIEN